MTVDQKIEVAERRGLVNDGQRVSRAIKQVDGKRLEYRQSVDNPPYLPQLWQMDAPFEGE